MRLMELKRPDELVELERQLDRLMVPLGLDVDFTRHFQQRIMGREQRITKQQVISAFTKLKQKYKQRLLSAKKKPDYEAILKDFEQELNIVFGIDGGNMNLITIKSKDPNTFYANVEGGDELRVGITR